LVAARYLINVDPWWNLPAGCKKFVYIIHYKSESQAEDRVHRIGQKHDVYVYRILIKSSIEEDVLEIQEKKCNQGNGDFHRNKIPETSFYNGESEKTWSIKEIHCVFNTIRVRQSKNNK
jgi:hypothetical protein